jgi:hypothetical protein
MPAAARLEGEILQIPDFPNYWIGEDLRVYGTKFGKFYRLAERRGGRGTFVTLWREGRSFSRQPIHLLEAANGSTPVLPADAVPILEGGRYCVTPRHEVWSWRGGRWKKLKQGPDSDGYKVVELFGKTERVSVLVCTAFHGPKPTPKHEARHLNGVSTDDRPENLAWGTHKQEYTRFDFPRDVPAWEAHGQAKMDETGVRRLRAVYDAGERNFAVLGRSFGINRSTARSICLRLKWRHVSEARE